MLLVEPCDSQHYNCSYNCQPKVWSCQGVQATKVLLRFYSSTSHPKAATSQLGVEHILCQQPARPCAYSIIALNAEAHSLQLPKVVFAAWLLFRIQEYFY